MERRSQHLADRTGMRAAVAAADYRVAVDYYYRGRSIGGRTFQGWLPARKQRFLTDFGVRDAVRDWQLLHTLEIPEPAERARRLFVGGHSLGGPLANFYCQWDFADGPGYQEIAGVLGVDGPITVDPLEIARLRPVSAAAGAAHRALTAATRTGALPASSNWGPLRLGDLAVLTGIAAIAARFEPDSETDILQHVPRGMLLDGLFLLLYPRGGPRRWRLTNAALFGTLFGRVAQATTLANDMGTYAGAVRHKRALLTDLPRIPLAGELLGAVLTQRPLLMPADPHGTLTGWRTSSDAISSFDDTVFAWGNGEFSYLNTYESRRLPVEMVLALIGARTGALRGLQHRDWTDHRPHLTIAGDVFAPIRTRRGPRPNEIDAPGYSHQDMLSATQPDVVVESIAAFLTANAAIARTA